MLFFFHLYPNPRHPGSKKHLAVSPSLLLRSVFLCFCVWNEFSLLVKQFVDKDTAWRLFKTNTLIKKMVHRMANGGFARGGGGGRDNSLSTTKKRASLQLL